MSCDASHVAVEFVHPITAGRPALAATNLVADLAMISDVGNDLGFEHVFVRQIIAQGAKQVQWQAQWHPYRSLCRAD
ncbi:hypothetical protein ACE103_10625 [Bradyrhizobium sp. ma5]|uniref:hypothetical protein n=1 Tax=Bradyrhizobium sp. ma5 TaxID=3344828 RepID=UPI0035D4F0FF